MYQDQQNDDEWLGKIFWGLIAFPVLIIILIRRLHQKNINRFGLPDGLETERSTLDPLLLPNSIFGINSGEIIGVITTLFFYASLLTSSVRLGLLTLAIFVVGLYFVLARETNIERWHQGVPLKSTIDLKTAVFYTIRLPGTTEWQPERARHLMSHLLTSFPRLTFRIIAEHDQIYWQIIDLRLKQKSSTIANAITAIYPSADIEVSNISQAVFIPRPVTNQSALALKTIGDDDPSFYRRIVYYKLASDFVRPIRRVNELGGIDPLVSMTQAMNNLVEGERVTYTLFVTEEAPYAKRAGKKLVTHKQALSFEGMPPEYQAQLARASGLDIVPRFVPEDQSVMEGKLMQPLYQSLLLLQIDTPFRERATELVAAVGNHVAHFQNIPYNILAPHPKSYQNGVAHITSGRDAAFTDSVGLFLFWLEGRDNLWKELRLFLEPHELAALWHLPHAGFTASKIVPASTVPTEVIATGSSMELAIGVDANNKPLSISRGDRRYHSYITGQTGMGKSTCMHNLIHQDIRDGYGVAVIDPHGSLVRDILETSIPPERVDDVVLLFCADTEYPLPLNPFRAPEGIDQSAVFNTVLWILKSIYAKTWSETQMETVMRNILHVVLADPEATPLDIPQIVNNPNYRRKVVAKLKQQDNISRFTRDFWSNFEHQSSSEVRSLTRPILNRMSAFLGSPHLEHMFCHPKSLDFRGLIRDQKIVLVSLKGDAIAGEVGSLGAIFFANLFLASMSLGDMPGKAPPRFYLHIDETQRFITTALPNIFSEARKFGLSLTLANQYIGQLDLETREGILNNVGTKFSFECSPDEARATAKLYEPDVAQEELTRLGMGTAAIRTRYDGGTLPAFIARTLPPPAPYETNFDTRAVIKRSQQNLGLVSSDAVKTWLNNRYESELFQAPQADTGMKDFE